MGRNWNSRADNTIRNELPPLHLRLPNNSPCLGSSLDPTFRTTDLLPPPTSSHLACFSAAAIWTGIPQDLGILVLPDGNHNRKFRILHPESLPAHVCAVPRLKSIHWDLADSFGERKWSGEYSPWRDVSRSSARHNCDCAIDSGDYDLSLLVLGTLHCFPTIMHLQHIVRVLCWRLRQHVWWCCESCEAE